MSYLNYIDNLERKHAPKGEAKKYFMKAMLPPLAMGAVMGVLFGTFFKSLAQNYNTNQQKEAIVESKIDRDELSDLVIHDRIYLAEPTGEYRRLNASDIYRIK